MNGTASPESVAIPVHSPAQASEVLHFLLRDLGTEIPTAALWIGKIEFRQSAQGTICQGLAVILALLSLHILHGAISKISHITDWDVGSEFMAPSSVHDAMRSIAVTSSTDVLVKSLIVISFYIHGAGYS